MLARRIIPCLDVKDGRVVKGVQFVDLRDAGDPVEIAARYDAEGADELCFLDITASHEERPILLDVVARTAERCFMPLTVGGGVRTVDDMPRAAQRRRRQGLDQHGGGRAIPSSCGRRPSGSARSASWSRSTRGGASPDDPTRGWEVFTHGGRTPTGLDALEWAARMEDARRRRDPAHQHGPRRHQGGLRPRS